MKRLTVNVLRMVLAAAAASTAWSAAPDGLWRSDGYGYLLEIDGARLTAYELTSISCIASMTGQRKSQSGDTAVYEVDGDLATFHAGPSPAEARVHFDGAASDVVVHRVETKPSVCAHPPEDTPASNYAIFWQTFAENYAFFDLRHVDWKAVDRQSRARVTAATSPKELFAILQHMIEPLEDAHTSLSAKGLKGYHGSRPDANHLTPDQWAKANEVMASKYLKGALQTYCNGHVVFGMLNPSTAYLRVNSFGGYAKGGYMQELHALESALDAGFGKADKLRGLVVDVRRNTGGADPLGIEIASRLTSAKYLAYTKVTRNNPDGTLHFTEPQESWVVPSARPGFRGPVILLTGPDTVSAGETFTMALMGRTPHVTRIGQNTQGVFSDVLGRVLPNGWHFGLPNEVYYTKDGKAFDGPGIPPETRVPYFSPADLAEGKDAALDKALALLGF